MRHVLILLSLLALPSLLRYFLPVSSFAAGAVAASLLALFLVRVPVRSRAIEHVSNSVFLMALGALIVIHLCAAAMFESVSVFRALQSLPLAVFLVGAAIAISPTLFERNAARTAAIAFSILLISAVLGIAGIAPPGAAVELQIPVFPFTEPSHFAVAFTPLLLWATVLSRGRRRYACLFGGLAIAALMPSLTLLLGVVLIAAICLRAWQLAAALGACTVGLLVVAPDLTYFLDRIDLLGEVTNLSALVWIQGWQLSWDAIVSSHGWGLGFQQLGIAPTASDVSDTISSMAGGDLNLLDGSFNFAKLTAEFGVFGFAAVAGYMVVVIAAMQRLRAVALDYSKEEPGTVLAMAFVVGYVMDLFVRGGGYFNGTGVLAVAALIHLARRQRILRSHFRSRLASPLV